MKKTFFSLVALSCLTLTVGCGGHKAQTVEADVSQEDQNLAEETLDDYGSSEYANAMKEDRNKKPKGSIMDQY